MVDDGPGAVVPLLWGDVDACADINLASVQQQLDLHEGLALGVELVLPVEY